MKMNRHAIKHSSTLTSFSITTGGRFLVKYSDKQVESLSDAIKHSRSLSDAIKHSSTLTSFSIKSDYSDQQVESLSDAIKHSSALTSFSITSVRWHGRLGVVWQHDGMDGAAY
eukprot:TRINITY_DN2823_c0_g1_i8.p2 TRINITY_DN2823_c0_g1~~TRINITY_DN2823_c0_g1_i8.p2  ORF type:complete len:113 (-),score=20.66 TRINITY_DN2823_c0_g1_i8:405-743(-)